MCFVYEWVLIHANGARTAQHRIRPCPAGTTTSPCADFELIREPARRVGSVDAIDLDAVMPRFVEGRPSPPRGDSSIRARRGVANPLRLEWNFHIPFTSRSGSRSRSSRRQSSAGIPGFGPVATTSATYTPHQRRQFINYTPADFAGTWQTWTPPPRVITVDPARHTPPETPSTGRRSRSVDATAGREHTRSRSYSRHRSSSSRPSAHRISPPLRRRESSPASVDGERARRVRRINARLEVLERDLARARARNSGRVADIEREIESIRRQRRPRPRTVEVHQGERTAVRLPHRPRHRAGESLDERGRRMLQRDVDAGAARYSGGGRLQGSGRRQLTNGDRDRDGFWDGLFRRGSLRRPGREHIVFEGEPRGGARHR